jgi:hypothetical protein
MSNETILAIRRRELAVKKGPVTRRTRRKEVPYRDLQAQAKDLDIPANQSREDLEAAIVAAKETDGTEGGA